MNYGSNGDLSPISTVVYNRQNPKKNDVMKEAKPAMDLEKMNAPSYRLLIATPMAAIMSSGKSSSQWSALLQSIAPIYTEAAEDASGEVNEALLTVSALLQGGDALIRQYFSGDSLGFDNLMEVSAKGADVWMVKLSDGEIERADAIKLFKAIQDGLIEAVGDVRVVNQMVDQFVQVQDKVIKHISSLN